MEKKIKKKNADGQRQSTNREIRMRTISDFSSKTMQQKEWSGLFKALIEKKNNKLEQHIAYLAKLSFKIKEK